MKKYYHNQNRIIEQAKFTYSPLGKVFGKQIKTIEEQGKKQVEALKVLKPNTQKLTIKYAIPENILTAEAKNEHNKIKEIEKTKDRENLVYRTNESAYGFKNLHTINTFGRDIYNGKVGLKEADEDQSNLLDRIQRKSKRKKILLEIYIHC